MNGENVMKAARKVKTCKGLWVLKNSSFGRTLVVALAILLCLAGIVTPILVDARHWWPRKPKRRI